MSFSETAVELATEIAKKFGADAKFVCRNVYDLSQVHEGRYDIVFTSIGVLYRLQDIDRWSAIIGH